jgi:hypothetical protein
MRSSHKSVLLSLAVAVLALGAAGEALCAAQPAPDPKKKKPAPKKKPAKKKKPGVKWLKHDAALTQAKSDNKPVALVFCATKYKGPAAFEGKGLFKALADSGALAVKAAPPPRLRFPKKADAEKRKKLQEAYNARLKEYQTLVAKYGVTATPKMLFLSPEGDGMYQMTRPTLAQVKHVLANLKKITEDFMAAKAKAAGKEPPRPAEPPKPAPKKPAPKKKK